MRPVMAPNVKATRMRSSVGYSCICKSPSSRFNQLNHEMSVAVFATDYFWIECCSFATLRFASGSIQQPVHFKAV